MISKLVSAKGISKDDAFSQTMKTGPQAYTAAVKKAINISSRLNSKVGANHVIFFDKNHPNSGAVAKAVRDIDESFIAKSINLKKLFLIPELNEEN